MSWLHPEDYDEVDMATLFRGAEDRSPLPAHAKLRAALALPVVLMAAAVLVVGVALPYVFVGIGVATKVHRIYDKLPSRLAQITLPQRNELTDRNGKVFAHVFTTNRVDVKFDQISPSVIHALVATEDSHFWTNSGVDVKGILRSVAHNASGGSTQGGSTITQQLVKNILLLTNKEDPSANRNVTDKIRELRLAISITEKESKKNIITTYLNLVYFGNNTYGIEAAAERYFGIPASKLTDVEAAGLIGMLRDPEQYDLINNYSANRERRNEVLLRMYQEHYITETQYNTDSVGQTPVNATDPKEGCGASSYPFYCQLVMDQFMSDPTYGATEKDREALLETGGLRITTALDPQAMDAAQASADKALGKNNRVVASLAAIQPGTGQVLAIAQNRDWGVSAPGKFDKTEQVYANTANFQIGSSFKPITAALALSKGFNPNTALPSNSHMSFPQLSSPPGGFINDDGVNYGKAKLPAAIRYSINTYFVGLLARYGVQDDVALARAMGMTSLPDPTKFTGTEGSLTLGVYSTSPLQLASVYATLAGQGISCKPITVLGLQNITTGKKLPVAPAGCQRVLSASVADEVNNVLQQDFVKGGTATASAIDRQAGGKSGTSDNNAFTSFGAIVPQVATGVIVADPRGGFAHPLHNVKAYGHTIAQVYGGDVAAPIWHGFATAYLANKPKLWFPAYNGVPTVITNPVLPDVRGLKLSAALPLLKNEGFLVKLAPKTAPANSLYPDKNYVVDMSPSPASTLTYGSTITLVLTAGSNTSISLTPLGSK